MMGFNPFTRIWASRVLLYALSLVYCAAGITAIDPSIEGALTFVPFAPLFQNENGTLKLIRYTGKIDQQRGSRWDGFKVKLKTIVNETANLYTREYTERISQMLNLSDDYNPIEAASKNNTLLVPDHTDPETIKSFAMMSYMAYSNGNNKEFDGPWDYLWDLGDEGSNGKKLGGVVYLSKPMDAIGRVAVIAFKGTSTILSDSHNFDRYRNDKEEDNLLFSCCSAKALATATKQSNSCYRGGKDCDLECLLQSKDYPRDYVVTAASFYELVNRHVGGLSAIWMSGHSLGGALASIIATIMNTSAITFASPGELLYSYRTMLIPGIDYDKKCYYDNDGSSGPYKCAEEISNVVSKFPLYNFGNDRDTVFNATCKGMLSLCYWMGYVLESRCHMGSECLYTHDSPMEEGFNQRSIWEMHRLFQDTIATHSSHYSDPNVKLNLLTNKLPYLRMRSLSNMRYSVNPSADFLYYHRMSYYLKSFILKAEKVPQCVQSKSCLAGECSEWNFITDK